MGTMTYSRRDAILAAAIEVTDPELARRLIEIASTLPNRTHGIRATYVVGCRCEPCTAANTAYVTARRKATRAIANLALPR